jgi:hypothetical protein
MWSSSLNKKLNAQMHPVQKLGHLKANLCCGSELIQVGRLNSKQKKDKKSIPF